MRDLERRDILLAVAGTTLFAMGNDAVAQGGPQSPPSTSEPIVAKQVNSPDNFLTADQSKELWANLKAEAVSASTILSAFDQSYHEGSVESLIDIRGQEKYNQFTHNPRLVEPLLGEIAALLDRCISYRREGSELEIAGVAAGASKIASTALHSIDREIAASNISGDVATVLANGLKNAANIFSGQGGLGLGHADHLRAETAGNNRLASLSKDRLSVSLGRLDFMQALETKLLARHDVPGNAHNFAERYERVRSLYNSDITSAYRRALAVHAGMSVIFGAPAGELNLDPSSGRFLDDFVIWTRDTMRAVNLHAEKEIEFSRDFVVNFADNLPVKTFDVSFSAAPFGGLNYPRLRGISAFFAADTLNEPQQTGSLNIMMIKSTPQIGPLIVVPLTNVRAYNSVRESQTFESALIYNADPRGQWTLRANATGLLGNGNSLAKADVLKRLIIRFHIIAVPNSGHDGSFFVGEDRL